MKEKLNLHRKLHITMQLRNKKGFTIIEALVAIFIFALITVTFYSTFTVGTGFTELSKTSCFSPCASKY